MEKTKILKPYTIIPSDLYVQRDADRQIKSIISDMGRPGYVLVSRQMGKTNLLLNAKRKLETPDDVFVYIDLSNPFDTPKSCFENIIDTAIETNLNKFEEVGKIIKDRRTELKDTPAHKQHTSELRMLLNSIPGKFVIILDEIDALTKTNYSDQIFAQIRSVYFSRVNFKELERLTYILSGVIEPNEIIKDPKISPFNIGQKIFLNDFNKSEFEQFLNSSQLPLSEEISNRIYFWTGGNPRMTWDVCSEVENRKIQDLTAKDIDKIVSEIYLTTFDKPPVDNIRELVKNDREIRNSIIEIEYKKGKEVSDKLKSKLYLSGIINYDEDDIHIKNEIIKQSLSLDWIKKLEEEDKGLLKIAEEQFEKEFFIESLNTFEKFLIDNTFDEDVSSLYYYYMGIAAYRSSLFEKASEYLDKTNFDVEEESKLYYRLHHIKGLVYYYRNMLEESLESLKVVIDGKKRDDTYLRALLNFGSFSLSSELESHQSQSIKIFEGIINEEDFNKEKLKGDLIKELKSISYYNLAQISLYSDKHEEAVEYYTKAIELSDGKKPAIVLALLNITDSEDEQYVLLNQLIDLIIAGKIKPIENDPEKPIDFSFDQLRHIAISAYLNNEVLFNKLLPALSLLGERSLAKHLYELALFSLNADKDWEVAKILLNDVYDNFATEKYNADTEIKYKVVRILAYVTRPKESTAKHKEYIDLFTTEKLLPVDYIDLEIFVNLSYYLTEEKQYTDALKYVKIIKATEKIAPENLLINYLVIDNLELNIYFYLNERNKAVEVARRILSLIDEDKIKNQKSNLLGETGLQIIKQNAQSILKPTARIQQPLVKAKSYNRNDIIKVRYKDGTTLEVKFKKVEQDLNLGECFILN